MLVRGTQKGKEMAFSGSCLGIKNLAMSCGVDDSGDVVMHSNCEGGGACIQGHPHKQVCSDVGIRGIPPC